MTSDQDDINCCKEKLKKLWDLYGIWIMLEATAEMIEDDCNTLEKIPECSAEIPHRRTMVQLIKQAAASPIRDA